jgi:hypothetical protein
MTIKTLVMTTVGLILVSSNAVAMTESELFAKLYESNLMLKEEQLNLKAIESSSTTIWSAPELAISEMNGNTPFINSEMKMQRSIEVSQMLPNPLRLSANKKVKFNNENLQKEQTNLLFKKISSDAYKIFVGIYQNQKEHEIFTNKKNQLEKFIERLRSTQVQGQEERIQISEAHIEQQELKLNLSLNQNELKRMRRMLNQMLNIDPDNEISDPVLEEVNLNKKSNIQTSSEVKMLDSKISLMDSDLKMKNSEFYPDFSLKAKFNKSYVPSIENSKEIMVGITLPFLFWGQQQNGVDTTHYKLEAMKIARNNQLSELSSKTETLRSEIEDLQSSIKLMKDSTLPIKEKKMKLLYSYSYTDMKTLMSYKMSFDDFYMVKMKILAQEVEMQKKYYEWNQLEK